MPGGRKPGYLYFLNRKNIYKILLLPVLCFNQKPSLTRRPSSRFAPVTEHETRSATNQSVPLPLVSRGAFATIIPDSMGLGHWAARCLDRI